MKIRRKIAVPTSRTERAWLREYKYNPELELIDNIYLPHPVLAEELADYNDECTPSNLAVLYAVALHRKRYGKAKRIRQQAKKLGVECLLRRWTECEPDDVAYMVF